MPLEFLPSSIYLLQSREYRSETTSQAHRFKQSIAIQSATEPLKIHVCVISVDKLDDLEDLARRPMIRTDTRANSGVNNSEVCRLSVTSSQGRAVYGICGATHGIFDSRTGKVYVNLKLASARPRHSCPPDITTMIQSDSKSTRTEFHGAQSVCCVKSLANELGVGSFSEQRQWDPAFLAASDPAMTQITRKTCHNLVQREKQNASRTARCLFSSNSFVC